MANSKKSRELFPFIKDIAGGTNKYFEILNKDNASKMHSGLVTLNPGEEIGSHSTGQNEELIIIVKGTGRIEVSGKSSSLSEGQIAYNPPETEHNMMNNSNEILKYIFIVSRA